jgi:hypothetical protein
MSKDRHVFMDGVGETRVLDGAIRVDLLAMSPTHKNADGTPTAEFVQQLVMTPVGFVRLVNVIRDTLDAMERKGLFSRADMDGGPNFDPGMATIPDAAVAPTPTAPPRRAAAPKAVGSSNF